MLVRGAGTRIALEIARNPLVLACAAGIAWKATALPLPEIAKHLLALLASAAVPLGLLAVGAGLTLRAATVPPAAAAWWHGVKLLAMPAIALALAHAAGLSLLERTVAVAMASVPTAPSAYILATQMKGDGASVALLISSGTLLAAITMPLWVALVAAS
jgi:predicted permease